VPGRRPLVGLLAAAHGDGRVAVYAVPQQPCLPQPAGGPSSPGRPAEGAQIVRMGAIMELDLWSLASFTPSCVQWLPVEPWDLLAVPLPPPIRPGPSLPCALPLQIKLSFPGP